MKVLLAIFGMIICGSASVAAQGADPEKVKPKNRARTTSVRPSEKRPNSGSSQRRTTTAPGGRSKSSTSNVPRLGALSIIVDRPNTEIFLSGGNIVQEGPFQTDTEGSPWTVEGLSFGAYNLTVRKKGFTEERRQIVISKNSVTQVQVKLKPQVAFLSVSTNKSEAQIEIEGFGSFRGAVSDLHVMPGTYNVHIRTPGFVSEKLSVIVTTLGEDKRVELILRPLPIDVLLGVAEEKLRISDYEGSFSIAKQIMEFDPANRKAASVLGRSRFYINGEGIDEMLDAVRNGERVRLLVRRFIKEGKSHQLHVGEMIIDRNYLEFTSNSIPKANFTLFKPDVSEISSMLDESRIQYLHVRGRGTFATRRSEQAVRIYPYVVAVKSGGQSTFCTSCQTSQCPCQAQSTGLLLLVSGWKNKLR